MKPTEKAFSIYRYDIVSSTNTLLKENYANYPDSIPVVTAKSQSGGRGQHGHSFEAKAGGLYFSFLLRDVSVEDLWKITPLAGICLAELLTEEYHLTAKIKWVNDIYVNNKKIAGILTESFVPSVYTQTRYVVVGIGLNVCNDSFSDEIKEKAIALSQCVPATEKDIEHILNSFLKRFFEKMSQKKDCMPTYRDFSLVMGKNVLFFDGKREFYGKITGFGPHGELLLDENNEVWSFNAGEIRKIDEKTI